MYVLFIHWSIIRSGKGEMGMLTNPLICYIPMYWRNRSFVKNSYPKPKDHPAKDIDSLEKVQHRSINTTWLSIAAYSPVPSSWNRDFMLYGASLGCVHLIIFLWEGVLCLDKRKKTEMQRTDTIELESLPSLPVSLELFLITLFE